MNKREKAQKLLEKINSLEKKNSLTLQDEVDSLISRLKDTSGVKTLKSVEKIAAEVEKFKIDFNLKPVLDAVKELEKEMEQGEQNLRDEFQTRLLAIPQTPDLTNEVKLLQSQFDAKLQGLGVTDLKQDIENFKQQLQDYINAGIEDKKELDKILEKLRREINTRLSNLGGGAMNRQMFINGVDPLTKYTDMNLKAGSNVTITYTNNNATKKVDVTITATGGGGGGGIVRSIQSISASQVADSTTGTDYVYLVSGTTTLTLPDATTNTNLYTVKNVGTGVVTINTTSGQTIDNDPTIIMPVRYTSVDLISDTANWSVT